MSVLLNIEVVDLSKAGTILIQNQQTHNGDIQIQPEIIASYFKPNRVTYSFVNGSHSTITQKYAWIKLTSGLIYAWSPQIYCVSGAHSLLLLSTLWHLKHAIKHNKNSAESRESFSPQLQELLKCAVSMWKCHKPAVWLMGSTGQLLCLQ